jgi:hypothetical protein
VAVDHIIIRNSFTLAYKLNLKELQPSDWFASASSNGIVFAGNALDGDTVLIMPINGTRESKKLK